jgi:hypothetical protein
MWSLPFYLTILNPDRTILHSPCGLPSSPTAERAHASECRQRGKEIVPLRTRSTSLSSAWRAFPVPRSGSRRRGPETGGRGGPPHVGLRRRHHRPLPLRPRPRARARQEAASAFSSHRSLFVSSSRFISRSRRQISYTTCRLDLESLALLFTCLI